MIFNEENIARILAGRKTKTRRIFVEGDELLVGKVINKQGNTRWCVNGREAVQAGRSKPGIARIRIVDLAFDANVRKSMDAHEAALEGYSHPARFFDDWLTMHDPLAATLIGDWFYNNSNCVLTADEALKYIYLPILEKRPMQRYRAWAITYEVTQ